MTGVGDLFSNPQPVTEISPLSHSQGGVAGQPPRRRGRPRLQARPQGKAFPSEAMLNSKFSNQTHGRFTYDDYNSRRDIVSGWAALVICCDLKIGFCA